MPRRQAYTRDVTAMVLAAVAVALVLFYLFVDPSSSRWVPQCAFLRITGWECPGCGSQRALHALLHGDIAGAWNHNPFAVAALPLIALLAFSSCTRLKYPKLYARIHNVPALIALLAATVAWFLYRNLF